MRIILLLVAACAICSCNNDNSESKESKKNFGNKDSGGSTFNPDSVLFSFVFMGCNRIDQKDTLDSNTNASTANVPELRRTFSEIAALPVKPVYYFFLGDEVLGLNKDTAKMSAQLIAWRNQYLDNKFSALPASGIQLVAIPGNHEMLYEKKIKKDKKEELPNKHGLTAWMNQMSAFIPAGAAISRAGGADSLDNRMTYSFTYQNTHFILLNTDTYNDKHIIGMSPASWIVADIKAARKDPAVQHIFLLGHKPALVTKDLYVYDDEKTMDTSVVKAIWPVMEEYRVEAMLSAHSHQYDRLQPDSFKTYQVIAGNGGSPYEHKAAEHNDRQFFGYTIVYIMKNQQVVIQSMGRSVPAATYLMCLPDTLSTTVRDQVNISWGTNAGTWSPKN